MLSKSNLLRKLTIYSGALTAIAGTSIIGGSFYSDMPIPFFADHILRFMRSAYNVGIISMDYKWSFRGIELGDPEYMPMRKIVDKRTGERLLKLCKTNKGLYVKFAQHIASLNHVLPIEITGPLSELQDKAEHYPFEAVVSMFQDEFKCHPNEMFSKFEETPIASASLAQVHIAYLPNNKKCAVKVQYPNMDIMFKGDFASVELLGGLVQRIFPKFSPFGWILPELRSIQNELDFTAEGKNADRTRAMFVGNKDIKIPEIYWNCSTKKILTMGFEEGIKINDLEGLGKAGIKPSDAARVLIEIFCTQLFLHGFVHSDLHPGNILARKENGKLKVILLDHGLYKELNEDLRLNYCHLWKAMILRNYDEIKYYCAQMGINNHHELFSAMLTHRPPSNNDVGFRSSVSAEDIKKINELFKNKGMEIVKEVFESLPRDLLFIFKTTNLVRSINKDLGATVNRLLIMGRYGVLGIEKTEKEVTFLTKWRRIFGRIRFELTLFTYDIILRFKSILVSGHF